MSEVNKKVAEEIAKRMEKLQALYDKVNPEKQKIVEKYLDSVLQYREDAEELAMYAAEHGVELTMPEGVKVELDEDGESEYYCDVGWLPSSMEC